MLRTLTALEGMSSHALDGPIGNLRDTFDDSTWTIVVVASILFISGLAIGMLAAITF